VVDSCTLDTPVGILRVFARDGAVCLITFGEAATLVQRRFGGAAIVEGADPGGAASALRRYFAGDLTALDALRIELSGTAFQSIVWQTLRTIPPGATISYRELARRVGAPSAIRAVGAANGANPIPIVVPCHRVIGSSGKLVGYGGGLEIKDWLLRHEGWRPLAP
jgi:methylated-DNA-[protein]-cysteine S-methyltransferase